MCFDRPKDRKVIENDNQDDENGGSHFYHLVVANIAMENPQP